MSDRNETEEPRRCHVCGKEIGPSTARSAEARDYTYYFCGRGCEQRWAQERHNPDHVVRSE